MSNLVFTLAIPPISRPALTLAPFAPIQFWGALGTPQAVEPDEA
jgi:hypothetical protein